jgi:hypothetical protein
MAIGLIAFRVSFPSSFPWGTPLKHRSTRVEVVFRLPPGLINLKARCLQRPRAFVLCACKSRQALAALSTNALFINNVMPCDGLEPPFRIFLSWAPMPSEMTRVRVHCRTYPILGMGIGAVKHELPASFRQYLQIRLIACPPDPQDSA